MNRGARHQDTFGNDGDRQLFLGLLGNARRRFGIEVHAYALMGNHYHLVLHTPSGGLSNTMQYLGSVYSQAYNERHGFDGPLFRGRFKSVVIEDDAQLLTTVRYVHRNPLEIHRGPLRQYRWSSHPIYLGHADAPPWLHTDLVMGLLGHSRSEYAQLIEGPEADTGKAPKPLAGRPEDDGPKAEHVDTIRSALQALGLDDAALVRSVAALVMVDHLGESPTEVTSALGYSSRNGTWSAVRRSRLRKERDPGFAELVSTVVQRLQSRTGDANTNAA